MNKFPTIIVRFKYHAFSSNFEEMVVNHTMKTSIECGIDTFKYNITKSCEYIFFDSFIIPRQRRRDIVLALSVRPAVRPALMYPEPYLGSALADFIETLYEYIYA